MTFLEVRNSTLSSSSVDYPLRPPWLNTKAHDPSLDPPPAIHSPPQLGPIQVSTISVSPVTSGIRADHP